MHIFDTHHLDKYKKVKCILTVQEHTGLEFCELVAIIVNLVTKLAANVRYSNVMKLNNLELTFMLTQSDWNIDWFKSVSSFSLISAIAKLCFLTNFASAQFVGKSKTLFLCSKC